MSNYYYLLLVSTTLLFTCCKKHTEERAKFIGSWRSKALPSEMGLLHNELYFSKSGECKNILFEKNITEDDALWAEGSYNIIQKGVMQMNLKIESKNEIYKYKYKFIDEKSVLLSQENGEKSLLYKRVN